MTGVGISTEWGLLMASISEDTGEETPLQVFQKPSLFNILIFGNLILVFSSYALHQVRLNGVATFIGVVGLSVAFSVLAVLLVRLVIV